MFHVSARLQRICAAINAIRYTYLYSIMLKVDGKPVTGYRKTAEPCVYVDTAAERMYVNIL